MNLPHASDALVMREVAAALLRASVEITKILVHMGKEPTEYTTVSRMSKDVAFVTYYWLDEFVLEGLLARSAVAPPSSR